MNKGSIVYLNNLNKKTKEALAIDANLNIELLEELSNDSNSDVRAAVASNINCSKDLFVKLSKDSERCVKVNLASNTSCPVELVEELANDKDLFVREAVIKNINCPIDIFNKFSNDSEKFVRKCVAGSINCPEEVLNKLSMDENEDVRLEIAKNLNCSKEILERLTEDKCEYVREAVLVHSNCPERILENLKLQEEKKTAWRILRMFTNPDCPLEALLKFSKDERIFIREAVEEAFNRKLERLSETDFSKIFDINSFKKDSLFDSINELNYAYKLYTLYVYANDERDFAKALGERIYDRFLKDLFNTEFSKSYNIDSFNLESFSDSINSLTNAFNEARNKGISFVEVA